MDRCARMPTPRCMCAVVWLCVVVAVAAVVCGGGNGGGVSAQEMLISYSLNEPVLADIRAVTGFCPPLVDVTLKPDQIYFPVTITQAAHTGALAVLGSYVQIGYNVDAGGLKSYGTFDWGGWMLPTASNSFTLSIWARITDFSDINNYHSLLGKSNFYALFVATSQPNLVFCVTNFVGGHTGQIYASISGEWQHISCVFDGDFLILYIAGEEKARQAVSGSWKDNEINHIGTNVIGAIDEPSIFARALTAEEIHALATVPKSWIEPELYLEDITWVNRTATVLDTVPLDFESDGVTRHKWRLFSGTAGCGSVKFNNADRSSSNVVFQDVGTFVVGVTAWNVYPCSTIQAPIKVTGIAPGFSVELPRTQRVEMGKTTVLTVKPEGYPFPSIKWQQYVDIVAQSTIDRRGIELYDGDLYGEYSPRAQTSLPDCIAVNLTADCAGFVSIANQTGLTFAIPRGSASIDGARYRVELTNSVTTVRSDDIVINVVPASSSGGDGDGEENTIIGAVVGSVLSVAVCCCCLLILLVLLLLLIITRHKRDHSDGFPGIMPDYDEVIFSHYLAPLYRVPRKQQQSLSQLEELLVQDKTMSLAKAIGYAQGMQDENISRSIMYVFHDHGLGVSLLKSFIEQEIQAINPGQATMFRSNSVTPRLFKHFSLLYAVEYLWQNLAPYVWELQNNALMLEESKENDDEGELDTPKRGSSRRRQSSGIRGMEVDPLKMEDAADEKINTLQLWLTAQKIFSNITRSYQTAPSEFREIIAFVHDEVAEVVPGEEMKAVGAFVFLRFFCPGLLSPQYFGLLDEAPLPTAQRQLILLAKVLQNLANDTLPGQKEAYMARLNEFIINNQDDLRKYFRNILSATSLPMTDRSVPAVAKENALVCLFNSLITDRDRINQELSRLYDADDPVWEQLDALLANQQPIPKTESQSN